MKKVDLENYKGSKIQGDWNEKFYSSNVEGRSDLHRIYVNGDVWHITEEAKEKLIAETSNSKAEENSKRITIIKENFSKLDDEAKKAILSYLSLEI